MTIYGGHGITTDILWEGCDEATTFTAGLEIITDFTYVTIVLQTDWSVEHGGFNISYGLVPPTVAPTTVIVTSEGFTTVIRSTVVPSTAAYTTEGITTGEIPISMTPSVPQFASTMGHTSLDPSIYVPSTSAQETEAPTTVEATTMVPTTVPITTEVPTTVAETTAVHTTVPITTAVPSPVPVTTQTPSVPVQTTLSIIHTCVALPTWFNIEFDAPIETADGPQVTYRCKDDYEFENGDSSNQARCDLTTGEWHPSFKGMMVSFSIKQ